MSSILLFVGGKVQLFDDNGDPLAGGKVYFYEPGTTDLKDTFTSSDLSVANANPVVLDANGRATVYMSGNYKVKVDNSADVQIYEQDNINPVSTSTAGNYNFVTNGSFEDNTLGDNKTPDGWTLTEESGSTVVLDTTDQQHGANAIKFTSTGSGGGNIISENFFEVNPNRDLDISYMLKASVVDVRNVVEILWYDENQASVSTTTLLDDSAANPTSWTKKEHSATPPATARFAKVRLYGCHPSDVTTGSTWFDDLVVKEAVGGNQGIGKWLAIDEDGNKNFQYLPVVKNSVLANHESLVCKYVSAATVDINADVVILEDASSATYKAESVNLTVDITTGGANGLDAGSEAGSTWYYLWVIYDGTTVSGLLSTSSTAPTMPSGYTFKGLVGAVYNDSSNNLRDFLQIGATVLTISSVALSTGTATTPTNVDLSDFVPLLPLKVRLRVDLNFNSGSGNLYANFRQDALSSVGVALVGDHLGSTAQVMYDQLDYLTEDQQIAYTSSSSSVNVSLYVVGWEY